jgi:cytochrome c-type biogenesis protein CcmH/NrfG
VKTRVMVAILAILLVLYIVLVGYRAVVLLGTGEPVGIAMGAALIVLPVVGVWALWREIAFGVGAERLGVRLETEGGLPPEQVETRESGRPLRDAADELFPKYRDEAEAAPDDWRSWYRLGLVYDGAGDRRRARAAIRQAIRLARD